jgi:hypothetical protein
VLVLLLMIDTVPTPPPGVFVAVGVLVVVGVVLVVGVTVVETTVAEAGEEEGVEVVDGAAVEVSEKRGPVRE